MARFFPHMSHLYFVFLFPCLICFYSATHCALVSHDASQHILFPVINCLLLNIHIHANTSTANTVHTIFRLETHMHKFLVSVKHTEPKEYNKAKGRSRQNVYSRSGFELRPALFRLTERIPLFSHHA